jgi:hypothetical protein
LIFVSNLIVIFIHIIDFLLIFIFFLIPAFVFHFKHKHTYTITSFPFLSHTLSSSLPPFPLHTNVKVENGDLNWCVDNKFIAFAGPHSKNESSAHGCTTLRPEDYISYFKKKNVNLIVRLNKKYYESKSFTSVGIAHIDLYFLDGSNPPDDILVKFLKLCEETR